MSWFSKNNKLSVVTSKIDAIVHFDNLSYRINDIPADILQSDQMILEIMKEITIYLTIDHVNTLNEEDKKKLCEGLEKHRLNNDAKNFFSYLKENHLSFELTPNSVIWKSLKVLAEYLKFLSKKTKTDSRSGRRL
jgi:hypothetical protein